MDPRELWKPNGDAIRRLRRQRGWSRFELAVQAAVSPHTIARAERGTALFPSTLKLIARALDKKAEDLCVYAGDTRGFDPTTQKQIELIYKEVAALDQATIIGDFDAALRGYRQTCHEDLLFSISQTGKTTMPDTVCRGIPAFFEHLRACRKAIRREEPSRLDEIRPMGSHQILYTGFDRVWDFRLGGYLTGLCTCLYTFRGERIASIQQSIQILTFNGQQLPSGSVESVSA